MKRSYRYLSLIVIAVTMVLSGVSAAAAPSPKEVLGHDIGEDYFVATYEDSLKYFQALAASTDRMKMFSAGKTTQGRPMEYAVISSPDNLANWETYKAAARTLASADGLDDRSATILASKSKIIVHIDGGMHSDEVSAHQSAIALAYKLIASPDDEEVAKILHNVIVVLWPTLNPDGMTMVADWYRKNRGTSFEKAELPWLYQEYIGHDNNRDGVMLNMIESQNISTAEQDYSPAIWYSHHQPGPYPARIWMPPFSDPISSNISPYIRSWTTTVGSNMMGTFVRKQMPGAIAQGGFDNWFPGYLDYISAFRHTVSFFTEVAHDSATPKYYDPKLLPKNRRDGRAMVMYPLPWMGGWWHLSDSIRYEVVASMSVLDTAMRYATQLQYDRYQAARDTINLADAGGGATAWVIPAGQTDAPEAALLAQKFIEQGLRVERASAPVHLGGADYPAGSWVIPMDQAYAGLVPELLGVQKYPDAFLDGDGVPKTLPYDVTGWTLSLEMGVAATEIKDKIDSDEAAKLAPVMEARHVGSIIGEGSAYALSRQTNASYMAANQAAEKGAKIAFSTTPIATSNGTEQGAIVVTGIDAGKFATIVEAAGATATALPTRPSKLDIVRPARVGLYRSWQGSSDEGWTRWVLEHYHFNPTSLHNDDVKHGSLNNAFDTIVLPDFPGSSSSLSLVNGTRSDKEPAPYGGGIEEAGAAALKAYVKNGGTLVAINRSADAVIDLFDLPVTDVVRGARGSEFQCAGALVHVERNRSRATAGLSAKSIVIFKNSPAFEPIGGFKGNILAFYQTEGTPVASGVMVHPNKIAGKAAALEVEYGKGRIFLYGFQPMFRGQLHVSYKLLFNLLYKYPRPDASAKTVEDDEVDGEDGR